MDLQTLKPCHRDTSSSKARLPQPLHNSTSNWELSVQMPEMDGIAHPYHHSRWVSPKESLNIPVKGKIELMEEGEESVVLCSASCLWDRRPEITFREGTPIVFHSFGVLRPPLAGVWLWAAARWVKGCM